MIRSHIRFQNYLAHKIPNGSQLGHIARLVWEQTIQNFHNVVLQISFIPISKIGSDLITWGHST